MSNYVGNLLEFRLLANGHYTGVLGCVARAIPKPGQYLIAHHSRDIGDPLGCVIFPAGYVKEGFIAAPPFPGHWKIGDEIVFRGPIGRGFKLPSVRHLALCVFSDTVGRLIPLLDRAKVIGTEIALFTDKPADIILPSDVEIYPIQWMFEALKLEDRNEYWADLIIVDIHLEYFDQYMPILQSFPAEIPKQIMINSPMPCGGLANCGVCSVLTRDGYQLVCKQGPVFDFKDIIF